VAGSSGNSPALALIPSVPKSLIFFCGFNLGSMIFSFEFRWRLL
jgi:hypothetical protein